MSTDNQEPAGGDVDRGPQALILLWVTASIAIVIVALRLLGRRMRKSIGWDDWTMLFTLVLYVAYAGTLTRLIGIGGMRHLSYLSPEQRVQAGKWSWVSQPFVVMGFATGKISVGLLLLRVVWETAHWRKRIVIFAITSALVITVINIVLTFVQCSPVEALWNPALVAQAKAKCWPPSVQTDFAIFLSSWNILTDVFLAVLPVTFMYNLKLSWRKKIGLCALLGLSFTAAIFATVKTKYLTSLGGRSDITWDTFNLYVWSASELFVIIVCGSVPPIKPVYDYIVGNPPNSSAYANYGSGSYPHNSGNSRASRNSRRSDPFKSREDELELYPPDTGSKAPSPYPSSHDVGRS
ncbi:hypothetical protein J3458_001505 [Metarhizium acridum]|uniref:Integral membrane protein n=1 Tax=Metarhizium acridum (strain CQMa 102) TaxID=655827 RepID=E9E2F0_METAQ|nr:uncharacterized protein MAC_04048 [Metarhizium acridum CQMa 102]EFY89839.1 integral membrane protein [Metarhizium acridum CQMa 102]KAG8424735.1 hypothetical protein J3458_001505 [Metarhizium acridum]